ncbi:hypothetical protein IMZ31_21355 (plasmid) [Pontibacillus sp. ALD_SL1]|uniref:hypothetical protein n=1 Tax=Pontibacillus sp. ALD_SL1 TaxID=2777185 RepID=UPI001A9749DA|nr:hypothetical protein [Pontibacillus sp. ALD_SL1]QST03099.1 hypothetical protein IMZ31_21355 [Pontibacillus sp. ALD_SL1]
MRTFYKFEEIYSFLSKTFIYRYAEYNQAGFCYYTAIECVPFLGFDDHEKPTHLFLRDGRTFELKALLREDASFLYGEHTKEHDNQTLTVYYSDGYSTVFNYRKLFNTT